MLTEYERFPSRPPEQVWAELARLAGSMLTFSLDHDLDAIPGYDHEEPASAFPPLFDLVTELLEASLPSRVIALEMSRSDGQTWKASLHDIRLREEADLYLSVRSDIPAWQVAEKFLHSVRRVHLTMSARSGAALKGIPLIPVSRVPAALPVRMENQYFALDMESPAAHEMQQQGCVCSMCLSYLVPWNLNFCGIALMRQDIDIDQLMTETWLTVTMLKKGAVTLNGPALYNKCVKQVESVREALERAGYDDASVEHISYAQCPAGQKR